MKKLLAFLLSIALLLAVTVTAYAGEGWSLDWVPEIKEAEEVTPLTIDAVLPVALGWDSVYHDPTIDVFLHVPHDAGNIVAVVLTDGYTFAHGVFERVGGTSNTLFVTFQTERIRTFLTRGAYLVIIADTGE